MYMYTLFLTKLVNTVLILIVSFQKHTFKEDKLLTFQYSVASISIMLCLLSELSFTFPNFINKIIVTYLLTPNTDYTQKHCTLYISRYNVILRQSVFRNSFMSSLIGMLPGLGYLITMEQLCVPSRQTLPLNCT